MGVTVQQRQQCYRFPRFRKALRHFQSDQAPKRVTNQDVWAEWLKFDERRKIVCGHVLNAVKRLFHSVDAFGLNSINRVFCTNVLC
jgi:hypothetical protein